MCGSQEGIHSILLGSRMMHPGTLQAFLLVAEAQARRKEAQAMAGSVDTCVSMWLADGFAVDVPLLQGSLHHILHASRLQL